MPESISPELLSRWPPIARITLRELRAYLACGVLAHGFLRVHRGACGHDRLLCDVQPTDYVPFIERFKERVSFEE